jgi:subtilisin family serine protease
VKLTATAANDSTFTGWGGACTGTGECAVTMSEARKVTATFDRPAVIGKVIDGYIKGARVFVDMNWSMQYEEGEPVAESDDSGNWMLEPSQLAPFTCYADANGPRPIIASVPASAVDKTRGVVEKPFNLVFLPPSWLGLNLPDGKVNLTPFTTLFATAISNAGGGTGLGSTPIPVDQACMSGGEANAIADRVRTQMSRLGEAIVDAGFSTQKLYDDYIASGDTTAQRKGEVLVDYLTRSLEITQILVEAVRKEVGVTQRIFSTSGFSTEAITAILGDSVPTVLPFDLRSSAQGIAVPGGGVGFLHIDVEGIRLRSSGEGISFNCAETDPAKCSAVTLQSADQIYKAAKYVYKSVSFGDGRGLTFAKGVKNGKVDCENRVRFDYEPVRIPDVDLTKLARRELAQLEFIYKMPIESGFSRFGCESGDVGLAITKAIIYPPTSEGNYYSLFRFGGQPSEERISQLLPYLSSFSRGDFIKTPFDRQRAINELDALPSTPNELPKIEEQLGSSGWYLQSGSKQRDYLLTGSASKYLCRVTAINTSQVIGVTEGGGAVAACYPDLSVFGLPVRLQVATVEKNGAGGKIVSDPAGIDCKTCNAEYAVGTVITLTAVPDNSDSVLESWSGACVGTLVCKVTMSEARSVMATFSPKPAPIIDLSASSLAFDPWLINETSSIKTIIVRNEGDAVLTVSGVSISGTHAGQFSQTNNCSNVQASGSCTISVQFRPTSQGEKSASLSIANNASGNSVIVPLSGTGLLFTIGYNLQVSEIYGESLGDVRIGSPMTLVVQYDPNKLNGPDHSIKVMAGSIDMVFINSGSKLYGGDYATGTSIIEGKKGDYYVYLYEYPPNGFDVTLRKLGSYVYLGEVRAKVTSKFSTRAPAAGINLNPAELSFSETVNSTSIAKPIIIKNTGNADLSIYSVVLSGVNSGDFYQTNNCENIKPADSCTVSISFTPSGLGERYAALSFSHNVSATPVEIKLIGAGISPPFRTLTVKKAGTGSGTIKTDEGAIDCGNACSGSYPIGTAVKLTATAANDSTFTGWSGACTGTGECSVMMSEARDVAATFALKSFALTVTKAGTGSGTVKGDVGTLDCGSTCSSGYTVGTVVKLTATAANDSTFTGWGGACTGTGECAVNMSAVRGVTATFAARLTTYNLSLSLNVQGLSASTVTGRVTTNADLGAAVTFELQSQGSQGTATINASTGVLSYTILGVPSSAGVTSDRVVVRASSGAESSSANVDIALRYDPLLGNQWHLRSTGQYTFSDVRPVAGADINVSSAWASGYSGRGVKIGIVDSGLEISHEDLAANVDIGSSIDFRTEGTNPTNLSPGPSGDHGTLVAGIIGSVAFNGKGGRGIAYGSTLRGYNWFMMASPENFARSFGQDDRSRDNDVFNGSFGGDETVLGVSYGSLPPFSNFRSSVLNHTRSLRSGKGAVVVMSAGNNFFENSVAGACDNAKAFGVSCSSPAEASYKQSIVPIIVGALAADFKKSSYSNSAPSIWISAPGGESGYEASFTGSGLASEAYKPAIISTNSSGCANYSASFNNLDSRGANSFAANCQYTAAMNGTSSAAPMVSGVVALMLEANPNLSYRDVAKILAETARRVDQSFPGITATLAGAVRRLEAGWVRNAAGYYFSSRYGFGAVDAGAAVEAARTYTSYLPPVQVVSTTPFQAGGDVSIGSNGKFVTFQVSSSVTKVEKVYSIVNIFMRDTMALGFNSVGATCTQIELE